MFSDTYLHISTLGSFYFEACFPPLQESARNIQFTDNCLNNYTDVSEIFFRQINQINRLKQLFFHFIIVRKYLTAVRCVLTNIAADYISKFVKQIDYHKFQLQLPSGQKPKFLGWAKNLNFFQTEIVPQILTLFLPFFGQLF